MPAIIGREINAALLVVGGDNNAAAVDDAVLAQVFFINAQYIGRRCGIGLHVIVELEAVELAEIARLADPKNDGLQESVEPAKHLLGRDLLEIPGADCVLNRLKERILADARRAAEH
jgi:hypothetical protein